MVINFMLSTQEATFRTQQKLYIHQSSQFVTQHVTEKFRDATQILVEESVFENDIGKLTLVIDGQNKVYTVENYMLYYDGIIIVPRNIKIEKFYLEPVYRGTDVVAVRINILFKGIGRLNQMGEINFLASTR